MTRLRPTHVRVVALSAAAIGLVVLPIAAAQAHPANPTVENQSADSAASPSLTGLRPGQLTNSLLTQLSQLASTGGSSAQPGTSTSAQGGSGNSGASQVSPEFCGPSGSGNGHQVTAQACVEHSAVATWARAYVTNNSTSTQVVALNLTASNGQVVETKCEIGAGSTHAICETPRLTGSQLLTAKGAKATDDAIAEILPVDAPVSAGVLHVESGQVS